MPHNRAELKEALAFLIALALFAAGAAIMLVLVGS